MSESQLVHMGVFVVMVVWVGASIVIVVGDHAVQSQKWLVSCREMPEHLSSAR